MIQKHVVAIVQARMGSHRLPGKTMMKIQDQPLLYHVIQQVQKAYHVNMIVVATSTGAQDDCIAEYALQLGVQVYRGDEDDVLSRFYEAAVWYHADVIVRITADCPLLDPRLIDAGIEILFIDDIDFVSNVDPPSFPDGMDVEIMTFACLEQAQKQAVLPMDREHVTSFIKQHPSLFKTKNYPCTHGDLSSYKLSVDTHAELELIRNMYPYLPKDFGYMDIISHYWRGWCV